MTARKQIAAIIREARGAKTQAEFARDLEVDVNTVSRWECGRQAPGAVDLFLIARLGGLKLGVILDDVAGLVAAERQRQKDVEGWTEEHDDEHTGGELAEAAACYLRTPITTPHVGTAAPPWWPWDDKSWKPTPENRERELIKAAALIVAEIERLRRAKQ